MHCARFNPGGNVIASCGDDGNIQLTHIEGQCLTTLSSSSQMYDSKAYAAASDTLAFSPDSKHLASAVETLPQTLTHSSSPPSTSSLPEHQVHVWDLQSQTVVRRFSKMHDHRVSCVAFAADGQRVASGMSALHQSACVLQCMDYGFIVRGFRTDAKRFAYCV